MFAKIVEPRAQVSEHAGGVRVTIPRKRSIVRLLAIVVIWLPVFAVVVVLPLTGILSETFEAPGFLAVLPAALYIAFGAVVFFWIAYAILWALVGCEFVDADATSLRVRREVFGMGRTRRFDARHVRNLRYLPVPVDPEGGTDRNAGTLAFDHGAKTYRLGNALTEPEVRALIELLHRHLRRA
jgi:hypothetical protein